eukprot:1848885-Heterocapsa_arctica.AAC.1
MRSLPWKAPPFKPAGFDRCDDATLQRWSDADFKFPPYTFAQRYCIEEPLSGALLVANADEREILSGFWPFYTLAGIDDYAKKSDCEKQLIEDQRLSQLGNSFHTLATSWLCAQGLTAVGLLDKPVSPDELQKSFFEEVLRRRACAQSPSGILPQTTLFAEPVATDTYLMCALVHGLLRRADHRGTNVRLDIGLPFRSAAWPRSSVNPTCWTWKVVL